MTLVDVLPNLIFITSENPFSDIRNPKYEDLSLQLYLKRDSGASIFLWTFRNFQETIFTEHLWVSVSEYTWECFKIFFLICRLPYLNAEKYWKKIRQQPPVISPSKRSKAAIQLPLFHGTTFLFSRKILINSDMEKIEFKVVVNNTIQYSMARSTNCQK